MIKSLVKDMNKVLCGLDLPPIECFRVVRSVARILCNRPGWWGVFQ